MRYRIDFWDDLYCVYKWDVNEYAWRICVAYETLAEAKEFIEIQRVKAKYRG